MATLSSCSRQAPYLMAVNYFSMSKKILTLCLVTDGDRVLLGMKKRGFGAGRWNGFGGKLNEGETIEQAAHRELEEECGIKVASLVQVGLIDFEFEGNPEILEVHVFHGQGITGEPIETEEMLPQWYDKNTVPFEQMWPDDVYWFPLFFAGQKFKGYYLFGQNDAILKQELSEVESF